MGEPETPPPGLLETLLRLAATILATLQHQLGLVAVELQEERLRLFNALLLTAANGALAFFPVAMLALAVVVLVWNPFGVNGLLLMSGLGLVSMLLAYWRLRVRLNTWPLLSSTLAELKKDQECLESRQ